MYAVPTSHIPSCDPTPPRGRPGPRPWLPLLAAALLLPSPALAQELRARDLSVIEDLLSTGIQEAIQGTLQTVNVENIEAQETTSETDVSPELRYIFRSTGAAQARGMFLEDYGVVFTVQLPYLTYAPAAMVAVGSPNSFTIVSPNATDGMVATVLGEQMQLRAQMSRMRAEIEEFTRRLSSEVEASGATSDSASRLRASIAEVQSAYNAYATEAARVAAARDAEEQRVDRELAAAGNRNTERLVGAWRVLTSADPETIARAEALARQQKTQFEGAIIQAVVETLAQYGRVIRGLEKGDRLAVVLLPSSYLSQIGSWSRATQRDEEFTISVRYNDILELDQENITAEEFGGRIRVESRLGQPHQQR